MLPIMQVASTLICKMSKIKKDEIFWQILNAAIELDFKKGHLKWTMTDLSRKSGITRSLIYYYFGRSKSEILKAGVKIVGEEFVGLTPDRMEAWKGDKFLESLSLARSIYEKSPFLCAFYLNNRNMDHEVGLALRDVEKSFISKLKENFPSARVDQINTLFAVYFGIVFSPHVGKEEMSLFVKMVQGLLQKHGLKKK